MSNTESQLAESHLAETLQDLTADTRALVQAEVEAARREMMEKLQKAGPGVALAGGAGTLAMFAAASCHRLVLRMLERLVGPAGGAALAVVLYGAGAAASGLGAVRLLRDASPLWPQATARSTVEAATTAAGRTA